ncbi:hypothetical protein CL621_03355 [archaeon]|nr:hypothetical protein [archaeon]|tara:strand:+ start:755 stop:1615 length:861 start_codon:yes stop_codon:yes gene_type:complete
MKISIVIPVYNERKSVEDIINRIKTVMKKSNYDYEIIVVDDCSMDNSYQILQKISDIKLIRNKSNSGYSASLKKGINESKGEYIIITDADGTYLPESIPSLLKYFKEYDMVVGAREKGNVPLLRKPAKAFISLLANILVNKRIPDINSGLRIFNKKLFVEFYHLFPEGFSFTTTITLACLTNNYSVKYIRIPYEKRKGKSSIKPIKDFVGFTSLIVRIMTYFKPLKMFSLVSGFLILIGILILIYSGLIKGKVLDLTVTVIFLTAIQILILGLIADLIVKERKRKW